MHEKSKGYIFMIYKKVVKYISAKIVIVVRTADWYMKLEKNDNALQHHGA